MLPERIERMRVMTLAWRKAKPDLVGFCAYKAGKSNIKDSLNRSDSVFQVDPFHSHDLVYREIVKIGDRRLVAAVRLAVSNDTYQPYLTPEMADLQSKLEVLIENVAAAS